MSRQQRPTDTLNDHADVATYIATWHTPANITLEAIPENNYAVDMLTCTLIRVTATWPDIRPNHHTAITGATVIIPYGIHATIAADMIYHAIRRLWLHELHEHITIGGHHHIDPHPATGGLR